VVLAACEAGRAAPVLHESVSLPNGLLEAGARGVLAATREPRDVEASDFFNAVRARIRQGASPAAALRAERMVWLGQKRGEDWVGSVLLFE
jgi:CHAT domain-containing protein